MAAEGKGIAGLSLSPVVVLLLLLGVLFAPLLHGAEHALDKDGIEPLSDRIEVLHDPGGSLGVEDLLRGEVSRQFRSPPAGTANFGYVEGNLWLRLHLDDAVSTPRILLVDHPVGGNAALFPVVATTGQLQPDFARRIRNYRSPAWRLAIAAGEPVDLYLRASNGNEVLRLPLFLMSEEAFFRHALSDYLFYGMMFAALLILALYNLFLAVGARDRDYLVLALFLGMLLLILDRDGNLFPALAFLNDTTSWLYPAGLLLVLLAGLHYWWRVSRGAAGMLEPLLLWMQWGVILALPLAGWLSTRLLYTLILILLPVLLILSARAAWRGHRRLRQTLVASLVFIVATFFYALTHMGWLTSAELNRLFVLLGQSGIVVAALALSIGQASESRRLVDAVERERMRGQIKDRFLATMSHELRTPMNAVVSTGTLLRQTPLTDEQREYLNRQEVASRHMLGLIDSILDLSRLEFETLQLHESCFQLGELIEDVEGMVVAEAESRGVKLAFVCDDVRGQCLYGDRQRLSQVLLNLLFNAIKFTPSGGGVTLRVGGNAADGHVDCRFEVVDSGEGIAPELQRQIFEPFIQAENDRSRHHGGAGLGLAISRQLVAVMGGELDLESSPGKGSRFHFSLRFPVCSGAPVDDDVAEEEKAPVRSGATLAGRRILVVEDDPLNRFFIEQLLRKEALEVSVAESGEEALERLRQDPEIDLVLMDVSMPGMDGYETTQKIRAELGLTTLPVIALTAHAIDGERQRCLDAGMDDYLTKPIDLDGLRATLSRWLDRQGKR